MIYNIFYVTYTHVSIILKLTAIFWYSLVLE